MLSTQQPTALKVTLDIDSSALEAAKQMAAQRKQSLGTIVSELILKALCADAPVLRRNGCPVFAAAEGKTITLEDMKLGEQAT